MRILLAFFLIWAVAATATAEREETSCEICGGTVYQTPQSYISGNTKYIYIDKPPYKPYCLRCQRDINNGKIDPTGENLVGQPVFNETSDYNVSSRGALIEARRGRAAEAEFLAKALQDLEDTGWAPIIERRLATLRAQ